MDLTKIEKPFWLLGDETRAALKAHGGPYEWFDGSHWCDVEIPYWGFKFAYRVKPQPVPVVITGYREEGGAWFFGRISVDQDTHRLTITTQDGDLIPGTYTGLDGATIKVEVL